MTDVQPPLTAIDIALEPDAVMMNRALADNAALRANVPQGFALDATHHAHVTLLQCFVRSADLPTIYVATEEILEQEKYTDWKLTAFKYYYVPAGPMVWLALWSRRRRICSGSSGNSSMCWSPTR
jgi:hypothetical protein